MADFDYPIDLDIAGVEDEIIEQDLEGFGRLPKGHPRRKMLVNRQKAGLKNQRSKGVVSTNNLTGKAEFEKRIDLLPKETKEKLASGGMQVVDSQLYSIVNFSSKNYMELLANADDKTVGVVNINSRKLEADQYFLLTGIQILSGTFTTNPYDATFGVPVANFLNGEFQLEVGGKIVVPRTSCDIFRTGANAEKPGFYKLENPKMIEPMKEIVPELWTPASAAATTAVKLILWGVQTTKA